jgi:hypothetical protein
MKTFEEYQRDYKDEYKKFQSSTKMKKYRAELNKYNRQKGTYGNNDKKDASHKDGKIKGFEDESINRGRREKSRLKVNEMNSFQGYLGEEVRWAGSLSNKLFDIGIGLSGLWLPMSSIIFKRIGLEENRATVFHVTDAEGYEGIKGIQGQKKSISAFFEMQNRYFSKGIQTQGGVILELDANILSAWREDVMSSPDKSGRRWIQLNYFGGMYRVQDDIDAMLKDLSELIKDLLKKYIPGQHAHKVTLYNATDKDLANYWQKLSFWLKKEKDYRKIMGNVVKDYIDGVEKVMKSKVKRLQSIFRSYLNRRNTDASWDELIVNMIKIKQVHAIDSDAWHRSSDSGDPDEDDYKGYLDFLAKARADGFKAKFWESEMDLEIYIRNLVQKEAGNR